jgi:hypothetical protein
MEIVNLSFRYAEQDYVRAMRTHYASRLRLPLDIAVITAVVIFGAYEARSGSRGLGIALLGVSGVFALMLVAAFTIIPKIAFRSQPKLRDDYSLRFSPQGSTFGPSTSIPICNGVCTRGHWSMRIPLSSTMALSNLPSFPNACFRTACSVRNSSDY